MKTKKLKKPKKTTKTTKKLAKKFIPPPADVWTEERVHALYDTPANTPSGSKLRRGLGMTHPGGDHEWEWEGEPAMPPMCLGCNATGDMIERENKGIEDQTVDNDRIEDEELFNDGFGDDILDSRYF